MAENPRLICASADLIEGGAGVRFTALRNGKETPAFAVRFQGRVHGYLNQCGHVPADLDWQPGEFFDASKLYLICSVHGALYSPETGRCLDGRCRGMGLISLLLEERDATVYLLTD